MTLSRSGPFAPHVAAITLGVRDVEAAVGFYESLGLTADVRSDLRSAVFQLNGVLLYLVRRGVLEPEMGPGGPGQGMMAMRHDVHQAGDLEAILARVTRAGGRVLRMPERTVSGGRRAWFADLDGHLWELAFAPGNRRDLHGGVWLPPRQRLEALADGLEDVDDLDTEDLGPDMVTAEELTEIPSSLVGPVGATPVWVEQEDEAEEPPEPPPSSASRPRPSRTSRESLPPRMRPVAPPVESVPTRRWALMRLMGWLLLLAAPVGGGVLAWFLIRLALP